MISRGKLLFLFPITLLAGALFFPQAARNLRDIGSPVVTARVTSRVTTGGGWKLANVHLDLLIDGTQTSVHADVFPYVPSQPGDAVRFRYSGDPTREVFLFEHEENPLYVTAFCWACSALFGLILWSKWRPFQFIRHDTFGWPRPGPKPAPGVSTGVLPIPDAELKLDR